MRAEKVYAWKQNQMKWSVNANDLNKRTRASKQAADTHMIHFGKE